MSCVQICTRSSGSAVALPVIFETGKSYEVLELVLFWGTTPGLGVLELEEELGLIHLVETGWEA